MLEDSKENSRNIPNAGVAPSSPERRRLPILSMTVSIPSRHPTSPTPQPLPTSNTPTPLSSGASPHTTPLGLRYMTSSSRSASPTTASPATTTPPPAPHTYPEAHRAASRVAHHSRSMSNLKPFEPPTPQNIVQMRAEIDKKPKRSPTQYQTKNPIAPGLSLESLFDQPIDTFLERIDGEIREEKEKPRKNEDVLKNLEGLHAAITKRHRLEQQLINERKKLEAKFRPPGARRASCTPEAPCQFCQASEAIGDKLNPEISAAEQTAVGIMEKLSISQHTSLLTICQDLIIEHAARRVEHFLYILIAYYHTRAHPMQQYPKLQHGQGRNDSRGKKFTDGAHSSLFSQFIDLTCTQSPNDLNYRGNKKAVARQSILCGTHYLDAINGVIELPYVVNLMVDKRLEGGITEAGQSTYRKEALLIIQDVANDKYDPIEGLKKYLALMKRAFSEIKAAITNSEKNPQEIALGLRALQLEEIGTFKTNAQDEILREYLNMQLGKDAEDKAQLAELEEVIRQAEAKRADLLERGMLRTKEDILSTASASTNLDADRNDPFLLEDDDGHSTMRRLPLSPDRAPNIPSPSSTTSSSSSSSSSVFFDSHKECKERIAQLEKQLEEQKNEKRNESMQEVRLDIRPPSESPTSSQPRGYSPRLVGNPKHRETLNDPLLPNSAEDDGCCPKWCSVM